MTEKNYDIEQAAGKAKKLQQKAIELADIAERSMLDAAFAAEKVARAATLLKNETNAIGEKMYEIAKTFATAKELLTKEEQQK